MTGPSAMESGGQRSARRRSWVPRTLAAVFLGAGVYAGLALTTDVMAHAQDATAATTTTTTNTTTTTTTTTERSTADSTQPTDRATVEKPAPATAPAAHDSSTTTATA